MTSSFSFENATFLKKIVEESLVDLSKEQAAYENSNMFIIEKKLVHKENIEVLNISVNIEEK